MIKRQRIPIFKMLTIGLLPSALKVAYYRMRGASIGRDVSIGPLSVLIGDVLEIGDGTHIGFATIIRGREVRIRRHVKIGSMTFFDVEKIFIDDDAKINEQVFAGGPMLPESYLHIGKNTIVMQYTFLNPTKPLIIGDGTGIGGHCLLFTHGSWQNQLNGFPVTFAPITLGKNVWLPWRVFIMPGVTIGDDATIGANSLVAKDIPAGSLAAGSPAKVLRGPDQYPARLTPEQRRAMLESILEEFFGFLQYHGYRLEKRVEAQRWVVSMHKDQTFTLFYYPGEVDPGSVRDLQAESVVLALDGLTDITRGAPNALWVDLKRDLRKGASEVGEETLLFLSRYGIRVYRVD